jgi:serine/threonine protein kinase
MTDEAFPDALPIGYRLHWYVIEDVLGQGGFGITHLAHDTNLDRRVAIKEYLPADFGRRRSDGTVRPRTEASAERYAWGLDRFLAEARTLAQFDHPNIVRVMSVFEANNTAYMVMRYEDGENLGALLARCGTLPERELLNCLLPILQGLQLVHEAGFIHRDIKPENIHVRKDGSPALLDFGSARQSFGTTKTMTILVAPGYAPLEQYYGDASTQGPWTDIYGLGATCYRAITGRAPMDAIVRAKGVLGSAREVLPPASEVGRGRYSERLLAAVDHALQLGEIDRPQSVADWLRELVAPAPQVPVRQDTTGLASPARSIDFPLAPAIVPAGLPPPLNAPHDPPPATVKRDALSIHRLRLLRGLVASGVVAAALAAFWAFSRVVAPAPAPVATDLSPRPSALAIVAAEPPPAPRSNRQNAPPTQDVAHPLPKVAAIVPVTADPPEPRRGASGALSAATPSSPLNPGAMPAMVPGPTTEVAVAPLSVPVSVSVSVSTPAEPAAAAAMVASPVAVARPARDEQIDAAEAALQHGDIAVAANLLAPLAGAGIARAQALLGRVKEAGRGPLQSTFEAYIWFSLAARSGEPGAIAMRDRIAGKLQPAEIRQAEQLISRWKPRAEAIAGAGQ